MVKTNLTMRLFIFASILAFLGLSLYRMQFLKFPPRITRGGSTNGLHKPSTPRVVFDRDPGEDPARIVGIE